MGTGQDTAESSSRVSRIPRSQARGWAGHREVGLNDKQDTAESEFPSIMIEYVPEIENILIEQIDGVEGN